MVTKIFFCWLLGTSMAFGQIDTILLATQIDSLVQVGLDSQAYPGCQVVVLHKSNLVFQKSYGFHTYESNTKVEDHHLYDLASVTKITTGLPLLMQLQGEGKFDPHQSVSQYLPSFEKSNKADLNWMEVLSHQAGLVPWLPHWQNTRKKSDKGFRSRSFKEEKSKKYSIQVSDGLYLFDKYPKKMAKAIRKSELRNKEYVYSGILFYTMPQMIEEITGKSFESYLYKKIYDPIGATRLRYRPLNYFDLNDIVPTEVDTFFRHQLVHGMVHDEGAAMMNGISCNAGLFGNARDLAKLGDLYCQYGSFDSEQIIARSSVEFFGKAHFAATDNRRGLGFDKPLLEDDAEWIGPCGPSASASSFGHSGFTGTYIWIDPETELVFVFLSNRVHPTRENRKLYSMNIRQLLHEACYQALIK